MGVGLPKTEPITENFWEKFQGHMGYTAEEMEKFKQDPLNVKMALKMASPEIQNKTVVFEILDVKGCHEGMRPGDKLYFKGGILLDAKRSDNWCAYAIGYAAAEVAAAFQNLIAHDVNPKEFVYKVRSCGDCGRPLSKYGFGFVLYKIYIVDEKSLEGGV
ncbi:MAG: hypothetical protein QW222_03750 [Candidatus Bathyarchaeia archaeon]